MVEGSLRRWVPAVALTSLLAACSSSACPEPAGPDTELAARNKAIVLEVFDALGSDDLATLERLFTVDGEVILGQRTRTRGGPYASFREAAAFPGSLDEVRVEVEAIVAEGDQVAIQSLICGLHVEPILGFAPTGKQLCSRYLNLYRLVDGKIVSNSVGFHRDQLIEQLEANRADAQPYAVPD